MAWKTGRSFVLAERFGRCFPSLLFVPTGPPAAKASPCFFLCLVLFCRVGLDYFIQKGHLFSPRCRVGMLLFAALWALSLHGYSLSFVVFIVSAFWPVTLLSAMGVPKLKTLKNQYVRKISLMQGPQNCSRSNSYCVRI